MSTIELHIFMVTVAIPGAVAAIVLIGAWRPWQRRTPVTRGHWGGAVGLGAAYIVGHMLNMERVPDVPPTQVVDWLPFIAAGAVLIGLVGMVAGRWIGSVGLGILAGLAAAVIMGQLAEQSRPAAGIGAVIIGVSALLVTGGVVSIDALAERARGMTPLILWVTLAGASYLLMAHKAQFAMQLAGVLAAGCAAAAVLSLWGKTLTIARGGVGVVLVTFASMSLVVMLFAELPWWVAILAFVTPHAAWAGDVPFIRDRPPWVRALVRLAAVGVAIGTVVLIGRPPPDPYGGLYEGY